MRPRTILVCILLHTALYAPAFGQTLGELPTVTVTGSTHSDIQHALNVLSLLNPNAPVVGKVVIPPGIYTIATSVGTS
jgi:hypothetical protein